MTDLIPLAVLGAFLLMTATAWRRRARRSAVLAAVMTAGVGYWVVTNASALQIAVVAVLTVAVVAVVLVRAVRTEATVTRWGNRSRRNSGVATTLDVARLASGWAMRRRANTVRPSLPAAPWKRFSSVYQPQAWRAWLGTPVTDFALQLARVGSLSLYASTEDVVTILGGPRKGKTSLLSGLVIDAPGAVLTTSTRLDVLGDTANLRATGGRPVWTFNPGGVGDVKSTIAFDPLTGCADPVTATERAADMIPESEGAEDRSYWESQARRVLAALMHAAALDTDQDRSMRDVLGWVADPEGTKLEVTFLLRRSPEPAFVKDIEQFHGTNDRTQSSITSTVMPALAWLTSSTAVASTKGEPFDVARLLRDRGTVYLIGRHEAHTAPLLAALTGYVAREARRLAALQPKGRLDPPLSLHLDEAHRVAPVPLPDWTGDMGGSGVQMVICVQSRADLSGRYGADGMAKVLNNSAVKVLFGGTTDDQELAAWSRLAGDRDEVVKTYGPNGKVTSRTVRKVPVLTPNQISGLPKFRAVIFADGMPPAIGWTAKAWNRRDVKRAAMAAAEETATPTVQPAPAQRVAEQIPGASQLAPVPLPTVRELVTNGHRRGES